MKLENHQQTHKLISCGVLKYILNVLNEFSGVSDHFFTGNKMRHFLSLSLVKHPTHQKPNHSPDETSVLVPKTIPFSLAKIIQNPHVLPVVKVPLV